MHKVLRKGFAVTRVKCPLIQGDSVGGDSQLIISGNNFPIKTKLGAYVHW